MDGYNLKRSCWLEISLDNVRDNFFAFKKMVRSEERRVGKECRL